VDLERDQQWNQAVRHETKVQRLDRNWSSLLHELRVVQTGVQLLTGLLLTLPFHDGFEHVGRPMRVVYLVTVAASIGATVLLIAPIGIHRLMFRQHRLDVVVVTAHRLAYAGTLLLAVTLSGVMVLIFGTVLSMSAGVLAGLLTGLALLAFWVVLPLALRACARPSDAEQSDPGSGPAEVPG
jgi:hypothetical protein